jgi:hypothetical protein
MGFAGLNIDELKRAFAKERIEAEVVEDDRAGDHCVLKLVDILTPRHYFITRIWELNRGLPSLCLAAFSLKQTDLWAAFFAL